MAVSIRLETESSSATRIFTFHLISSRKSWDWIGRQAVKATG